MQSSEREVLILKPTRVFLSFLAAQLPEVVLPDLRQLQIDNTAYIISKHPNDEETLNEIENHFATMFRHEIARWLGEDARNKIEGSFLDFLCCFKFELHSQIVLMESSLNSGKQLLRIKPRSVLLKWLKSAMEEQKELVNFIERINLTHLTENATVVVKNFNQLLDVEPFLQLNYRSIFEAEMLRMCEKDYRWPEIDSYQTFNRYFAIETHSQLVHLH